MHSDICSLSHLHPLGECQDVLGTMAHTFFDAHACIRHKCMRTKSTQTFTQGWKNDFKKNPKNWIFFI